MIEGKAKADLDRAMEAYIEDEVSRRIKDIPVHLSIDGEVIDMTEYSIDSGEIYIELQTPLYYPETGAKGFVEKETVSFKMPRRLAV